MKPALPSRGALVCWALAGLGIVLRVHDLGFPARFTLDEHHFVSNARAYLLCQPDTNDHPALGKLLMALGMLVAGDGPWGWRLMSLVSGIASVLLAAELAERWLPSGNGRAIGAALVALDGLFVAYSRVALLDGQLAALTLLLALLALGERSDARRGALVGALAGAAGSIKWTGFTLLLPWFSAVGRLRWRGLLATLGVAAGVAFAIATIALAARCEDASPGGVLREAMRLYERQMGVLPSVSDRLASSWWTWLWMDNPITLRIDYAGEQRRYLSTLTSPLVWWLSSLVALAATLLSIVGAVPALRRRLAMLSGVQLEQARRLVLLFWSPILPWILVTRPSYIYHFMPSHGLALAMLAGLLGAAVARWPRAGWAVTFALLATMLVFLPLSTQLPVPADFFLSLLWMRNWG